MFLKFHLSCTKKKHLSGTKKETLVLHQKETLVRVITKYMCKTK